MHRDRPGVLMVLCTVPARGAGALADLLLERHLAAGVSISGPVESRFHWKGRIETADEVVLLIRTAADRFDALRDALEAAHPYEVPEILALPVADGAAAYLGWVVTHTRSDGSGRPGAEPAG